MTLTPPVNHGGSFLGRVLTVPATLPGASARTAVADWKSATPQVGNLRYKRLGTRPAIVPSA